MKTIFKYIIFPFAESNPLSIPSPNILSVQSQKETIVAYALMDKEKNEPYKHYFKVFGTGQMIPDESIEGYSFLGTVKMFDDSLIYHVFHKVEK